MSDMRMRTLCCLIVAGLLTGGRGVAQSPAEPSPLKKIGMDKQIWIAVRTDGLAGTGTAADPFDGSGDKFDALMIALNKARQKNITIHLGPGTFRTCGADDWRNLSDWRDRYTGWRMDEGWKLIGAGMGNTTIQFAGVARDREKMNDRLEVSVRDGLWEIPQPPRASWWEAPEMWRGVRLIAGEGLKGLEIGTIYYIAEVVDGRHFRVSATPGGPVLRDVAVGSGGQARRVPKVGIVGMNHIITGSGADLEVRDLTLDCDWPGQGAALTEDFVMPAELATVVVSVDSTTFAKPAPGMWVNLVTPGAIQTTPGHFEIVRVLDDRRLELRNVHGLVAKGGMVCVDAGTTNAKPGTVIPKGTRMGPEMLTVGVSLLGDRARIERVHVRNIAGTWYEGTVAIMIGHYGSGPCHDMVVRDCVVSEMWGILGGGIYIESRAISGGPRAASQPLDGSSGIIENNTVYGNGAGVNGLSAGGSIRTVIRNNRIYNKACMFYVEGPINDYVIRDNFFSGFHTGIQMNSPGYLWNPEKTYQVRDTAIVDNVEYVATAQNTGQKPPNEECWQRTHAWLGNILIEGNTFEAWDGSAAIQFMGNVDGLRIRDNVFRYDSGHGQRALAITVSEKSNRNVFITGNVIDSGMLCSGGKALVLGRDNVDQAGRLRRELEVGSHAPRRTGMLMPKLDPLTAASDLQQPDKSPGPLVIELGKRGEIENWLVLGPLPHPPGVDPDGNKLGLGYDFDFLTAFGGEAKARPLTGQSVLVKFPGGEDAKAIWKSPPGPTRVAWQRVQAIAPRSEVYYPFKQFVNLYPLMQIDDTDNMCAYVFCILRAEKACKVAINIGSDDGCVLFVNGQREGEARQDRRSYAPDTDVHRVALKAGDNTVLIKVCNALGGFLVGARVTSAEMNDLAIPGGRPPDGVKVVLP